MPPSPKLRKRKSALLAQERESQAAERMAAKSRARARASLESAEAETPATGMEVKPTTSSRAPSPPPARGTKRKASDDTPLSPRFSPPPIEIDASDDILQEFAQAIGRDPLVARLIWRGLRGGAATLWSDVEEYVLFSRQQGVKPPFFPANRVDEFIAHKALVEYKVTGTVSANVLQRAVSEVKRLHDSLGLAWHKEQERATELVIRGAVETWGDEDEGVSIV